MPEFVQCIRCGRIIAVAFTGFISWHITEDGQAICPHCLTPSETIDEIQLLTDSPEDELLRELDPDNEEDEGR